MGGERGFPRSPGGGRMCSGKRPAYECGERLRAELRPELRHGDGHAAFVPVRVILPVDVLVTLRQLRRSRSEGRSNIHHRDACLAQAALELSEQDVALGSWTRPREQWRVGLELLRD